MEQEQEREKRQWLFSQTYYWYCSSGPGGYGLVMPGKELPAISLAAELLPVHLPIPGFEHGIPNTLPTAIFTSLFLIIIAFSYHRAVKKEEKTGKQSGLLSPSMQFMKVYFHLSKPQWEMRTLDLFFPLIGSFLLLYPVLKLVWIAARNGIDRCLG